MRTRRTLAADPRVCCGSPHGSTLLGIARAATAAALACTPPLWSVPKAHPTPRGLLCGVSRMHMAPRTMQPYSSTSTMEPARKPLPPTLLPFWSTSLMRALSRSRGESSLAQSCHMFCAAWRRSCFGIRNQ